MLQLLWVVISAFIVVILYIITDVSIISLIDAGKSLSSIHTLYFKFNIPLFLMFWVMLIIAGCFLIQKNRFEKYGEYFKSGLDYLNGKTDNLVPFHESLTNEYKSYIIVREHQDEIEEKYKKVYEEKTDLLTYLAHDIKTPISNLLGYASLLNEEELTETQQKKFKSVIYENAKYLNGLTDDFFVYLKYNLHEIPMNIINVGVELFFKQWEEERSLSITENTLIIEFVGTKDKEFKIAPELLVRIMDNLLINAKKYSKKETPININVEIKDNKLRISVINEVEEDLSLDFKTMRLKFRRGDISRNRIINSGSGLGLTIVDDLVRHMCGDFDIYKEDNKVIADIIFLLN